MLELWADSSGIEIWTGCHWASRPTINRERSVRENQLLSSSKTLLLWNPNLFSCCAAMSSFLFIIKWRKGKERMEYEEPVIRLFPLRSLEGAPHWSLWRGCYDVLFIMTGRHVKREAQEGRMRLQLTQAERYWLFPLVEHSLFAGDLESLHLVVILLLGGTSVQTWFHHCLASLVGARRTLPLFSRRASWESSSFSQRD